MSKTSRGIPSVIKYSDDTNLIKEQYLGKGAFGKCYGLKCVETGEIFAGKCLNKYEIEKCKVSDKIIQEITIHKRLFHKHIVSFCGYIEDKYFIYIILELCLNKSMAELIKRRKYLTSFEAKYYMKQLVSAVSYLHEHKIIHRDLKLGNLFLNHNMEIKVGDFGLAVCVKDDKTSSRSFCGTPNYIAPEVLNRKGHSFEVDIWALGCILYSLLVGVPPFQTETVQDTYSLIQKCQYDVPESLKKITAYNFVKSTLNLDPKKRPKIYELSNHEFLHIGFIPKKLPLSCMVMPPRTKTLVKYSGRRRKYPIQQEDANLSDSQSRLKLTDSQLTEMFKKLYNHICEILRGYLETPLSEDAQDPSLMPFVWINSWVDLSHHGGFGYRLNDNTVGVLFNDCSRIIILPSGKNIHYIHNDGSELYFHVKEKVDEGTKYKLNLAKLVRRFMFNSLKNAYTDDEVEPLAMMPLLDCWLLKDGMICMFLSNGTVQINFTNDHIKLILCPVMEAITIITSGDVILTYQLDLFKKYGYGQLILNKLSKSAPLMKELLNKKLNSLRTNKREIKN